ncbi:hypothetical protein F511_25428 [Dorcoceras hygrometricum]|uniref:Uncharacterized protein n=1 Tax=Dorcoceras hygrometricum TaxID=472368 RepID=A0A2Z7CMV4_9LAMI|nr:hypothetical protein F511_25428 [Dorcoceras hygrometricum]
MQSVVSLFSKIFSRYFLEEIVSRDIPCEQSAVVLVSITVIYQQLKRILEENQQFLSIFRWRMRNDSVWLSGNDSVSIGLEKSAEAFFREISRRIISADEESSAGALSVDDISSDVINQQEATIVSAAPPLSQRAAAAATARRRLFAGILFRPNLTRRIRQRRSRLTRSARTDSPRRIGRNEFRRLEAAAAAVAAIEETCWHLCLAPTGITRTRLFSVDCGRNRQSGPRPETRLLRQPALEGLTRSARTDSPRRIGRNEFRRLEAAAAAVAAIEERRGSYFNLDSIGYPRMSASGESSTTMHRLLHASGSHPIPTHYDPKRVGKRVKVRRLSCRVSMTFRVVRTNQHNQDLGLIHSTNGNHLENPKEGSSIDHQVTIYLHAQNITMFPTNETWYFASQILVSNSGGLILILTAQSTRNMFRIHSDYQMCFMIAVIPTITSNIHLSAF